MTTGELRDAEMRVAVRLTALRLAMGYKNKVDLAKATKGVMSDNKIERMERGESLTQDNLIALREFLYFDLDELDPQKIHSWRLTDDNDLVSEARGKREARDAKSPTQEPLGKHDLVCAVDRILRHQMNRNLLSASGTSMVNRTEAYFSHLAQLGLLDTEEQRYHPPKWVAKLLTGQGRSECLSHCKSKMVEKVRISCAQDNLMGLAAIRRMASLGPSSCPENLVYPFNTTAIVHGPSGAQQVTDLAQGKVYAPFVVFGISFLLASGHCNFFDLASANKRMIEDYSVLVPMHFSEAWCMAKNAEDVGELLLSPGGSSEVFRREASAGELKSCNVKYVSKASPLDLASSLEQGQAMICYSHTAELFAEQYELCKVQVSGGEHMGGLCVRRDYWPGNVRDRDRDRLVKLVAASFVNEYLWCRSHLSQIRESLVRDDAVVRACAHNLGIRQ